MGVKKLLGGYYDIQLSETNVLQCASYSREELEHKIIFFGVHGANQSFHFCVLTI